MFQRYVAIGDSTTEGLEDPYPDGSGYRGWADRLAERVAAENPALEYANLAVRGRQVGQIRAEQLEPALAFEPDLVTVVGGINDVLRRSCDLEAVVGDMDAMLGAFRAIGATVLTFTMPDPAGVNRLAGRVWPRLQAYNARLRELGARHGAIVVDFEPLPWAADPRLWHTDRLHANSEGHRRIADALAHALGLPAEGWDAPLDPATPPRRLRSAAADAEWAARHLTPWVVRRLRGRSSGDGRVAKRPQPARWTDTSQ
jgi:lysophospholipase L1-like esterase